MKKKNAIIYSRKNKKLKIIIIYYDAQLEITFSEAHILNTEIIKTLFWNYLEMDLNKTTFCGWRMKSRNGKRTKSSCDYKEPQTSETDQSTAAASTHYWETRRCIHDSRDCHSPTQLQQRGEWKGNGESREPCVVITFKYDKLICMYYYLNKINRKTLTLTQRKKDQ